MLSGCREDERILSDRLVREGAKLRLQSHQQDIEFAADYLLDKEFRLVLRPAQREFRVCHPERGVNVREQVGTNCRDHTDTQGSRKGLAAARRSGSQVLRQHQHLPCALDEFLSCRCDEDLPSIAFEELNTQRAFELGDLRA